MESGKVECRAVRGLEGASLVRSAGYAEDVARHAHRSLVVSLVLRGCRRVAIAGQSLVAGPGSVMTVAPGVVHSCTAESPLDALTLCLPAAFADGGAHGWEQGWAHPGIALFQGAALAVRTAEVWTALHDSGAGGVPGLLELLARLVRTEPAARLRPASGNVPGGVRRVRQEIDRATTPTTDHATPHEFDGEHLARLAGMSPWGLNRAFARAYGLPPHGYGLLKRIERARALLARGLSPAQVAAETGFADQSHLTRRFKRLVGLTPARYARAFAPEGEVRP